MSRSIARGSPLAFADEDAVVSLPVPTAVPPPQLTPPQPPPQLTPPQPPPQLTPPQPPPQLTPPQPPPEPPPAVRLDRTLVRLARTEAGIDRELGLGLASLWDRELYVPLGSARATDFVREHLGIQESRARWLARLGRLLNAIPELDQALVAGRIGASQAIELGKVMSADTPPEARCAWIERGAHLSVRELRRAVRAERAVDAHEVGGSANEVRSDVNEVDGDPDDVPAGGWMTIRAPARVAVLWHGVLDLARAASGRHISHGQAAEYVFAEYLSASQLEDPELPSVDPPIAAEPARSVAVVALAPNLLSTNRADTTTRADTTIGREDRLEELPSECRVSGDEDPWELAATLLRLNELKKQLRYELASTLAVFARDVRPSALGFPSFEIYCIDRLGFGIRRAERLIRFHTGLEKFPRLAAAYLDGRVSYTAALFLLPILHSATEDAWVQWADGVTYRELERVAEYARTFALPEAQPSDLESWVRELEAKGLAHRVESDALAGGGAHAGATAFAAAGETDGGAHAGATALAAAGETGEGAHAGATAFAVAGEADGGAHPEATAFAAATLNRVPLGCALPPEPGALPRIVGLPDDLALAEPELCVAQIRFWLPQDALDLARLALDRCRRSLPDAHLPTWAYFEFILVHFVHTHDTPEARALERRHRIIARDGHRCTIQGCTSRTNLHSHHMKHRAQGGTDHDWNKTTGCAGHHGPCLHAGVIEMGGFAPHQITTRLGINPKTGRAFACYRNERRVSEAVAQADLARWRKWWRDRQRASAVDATMTDVAPPLWPSETQLPEPRWSTQNSWRSRSSAAGLHPVS